MKAIALLDCDGVLANFAQGFVDTVNQLFRRGFCATDINRYEFAVALGLSRAERAAVAEMVSSPGWVSTLEVLPGAVEGVKALRRIAEVFVVTSCVGKDKPHWMPERLDWLEHHFGIDHDHVIFAKAKDRVHGDVFVDDDPSNVRAWARSWSGPAVLWAQPYNVRDRAGIRTSSWRDVVALVSTAPRRS